MSAKAAVERYFYLITPHAEERPYLDPKTKKKKTKTIYVTNYDKREDFIKKFKQKGFERACQHDENMAKLQDIPIPPCFEWLFGHFLRIWRHCETDINGNIMLGPRQILDYMNCFNIYFTVRERDEILMFKEWATISISQVKKENKND